MRRHLIFFTPPLNSRYVSLENTRANILESGCTRLSALQPAEDTLLVFPGEKGVVRLELNMGPKLEMNESENKHSNQTNLS